MKSKRPKQTSVNVSLTVPLRDRLDEKWNRLAYSSASEYVRDLIRRDLEKDAIAQVDQLLLEGLRSPVAPLTDDDRREWRRLAGGQPSTRRHAAPKAVASARR